jgi:hypothetical protein
MCEICFSVNFSLTQWVFPHIIGIKREIFIVFGVRLDQGFLLIFMCTSTEAIWRNKMAKGMSQVI